MDNLDISFRTYLLSKHHAASTIKSYDYIVARFLNGNPKASEYNYKDVFEYLKGYVFRFNVRPSIALIQSAIKKYYDFLIHTGKRNDHPCRGMFLKQRPKPLIHQDLFSSEELGMLLKREERYSILKYRNKVLISLLIYQGITLTELVRLKVNQVNLDNGTVLIRRTRTTNARSLSLIDKQIDYIEKYLLIRDAMCCTNKNKKLTGNLLLNKLGNPLTADDAQYIIETLKYQFIDRKLSPKMIRQSVISNWLNEKQIPLEQVQLLSGHKWLSSTLRYRQPDIAKQVELINGLHPVL